LREKNDKEQAQTYQTTDNPEQLLLKFTDNIIDEQGEKKGTLSGKKELDNQISAHLFGFLDSYHVPTHFIKVVSETEILVKNLEMIPFNVVVRNFAGGEIVEKLNIERGRSLKSPILEYSIKNGENEDIMISSWHAVALGYVDNEQIRFIERMSSKINALFKSFFMRRQLKLIDFELRYGKSKNKILLAGVLSLDTIKLMDVNTNFQYDHTIFDETPSRAIALYENILKRIIAGDV